MQVQNSDKPPQDILDLAKYLRSTLRSRNGILNGRRVDYFKGKSARKILLSEAYKHKSRPTCESKEKAEELLHQCLGYGLFLACDKNPEKNLIIHKTQQYSDDTYYVWIYQGSQVKHVVGGFALVAIVMAAVMFPLWPPLLRNGVWYLSVGVLCLLGLFFLLAIVRLILYLITFVVVNPGIWIFPNLFEDVGIIDSFIPLWAWDAPVVKKKKKTIASSTNKGEEEGEEVEEVEGGDDKKDD